MTPSFATYVFRLYTALTTSKYISILVNSYMRLFLIVATQFNDAMFAVYCSSLWGGGGGAGSVEGRVGYKSSWKS